MAEASVANSHDISRTRVSSVATTQDIADVVECADGVRVCLREETLFIDTTQSRMRDTACFGLTPPKSPYEEKRLSIKYRKVLWAEASSTQLTLVYTKRLNKQKIRPHTAIYPIRADDVKLVQAFVQKLLSRAYGQAQQRKRITVIINPFGGKGKAMKYWFKEIEPIIRSARCEVTVIHTTHTAHAVHLGEGLDINNVDVVACCSGDGVPYEVINGLGRKKNAAAALAKIAVVQLPCGSGNALSWNCNGTASPSKAALAIVKGVRTRMDLASVTQGEKRTLSFLSQSLAIVAECDLGTDNLRWLGDARFTFGFMKRLLGKTVWPMDIAVAAEMDDKKDIEVDYRQSLEAHKTLEASAEPAGTIYSDGQHGVDEGLPPLRYGTINDALPEGWKMEPFPNLGNFYAGNAPFMAADAHFFPFARISDGYLDLITIRGDISVFSSMKLLFQAGEGKLHENSHVQLRKVTGFRVIPRLKEGYISVDGESYPHQGLQVEVHRELGCTLTPKGRYVRRDELEK